MTLWRLAWRNLRRNRRRTALMVSIVAVGTWAIVVLWGVTDGFYVSMIRAQITLDTGDLQVHRVGYLDDPNLDKALSLEALERVLGAFQDLPSLAAYSVRLSFEGLLKSAYTATGVNARGVEPAAEIAVTDLEEALVEGRYLEGPGEILLGRALAEQLDVRLGERLVLQAQGLQRPHSQGLRVVGLFSTGLPLLDKATVFLHLEDARALTEVSGASGVSLRLRPGTSADRLARALQARLSAQESVATFLQLNPLIGNLIKIGNIEMMPTMFLLALLAGFGVANTVTFTVLERTREFGVMLALGLKPRQLARLVTLESLLASGAGFLLGGGVGYLMNAYLERVGFNLSAYSEAFPDLGLPHVLYAKTSGWYWLYGLTVIVLVALIAARYPARRAARLEPTEAMRYV